MRPSLQTLVDRVSQDLSSRLGGDPKNKRSNLYVLAVVQAGLAHGLYGHLEWVKKQLLPTTADLQHLEQWAGVWGLKRKDPTYATGLVALTGSPGAIINIGVLLRRVDGVLFATQSMISIGQEGVALATVQAQALGENGNTAGGSVLTLVSPVPGVNSSATVGDDGLAGGADLEEPAALLGRLLQRVQKPPYGGSTNDYETWARSVAGVDRVWVYGNYYGPGTVGVAIATADRDDPRPSDELVESVAALIDQSRPVTAAVTVFKPSLRSIAFQLSITPDTPTLRQAVVSALQELFYWEAAPGGVLLISHIRETLSTVLGEHDHVLVTPTANISLGLGELAVVGEVSWL